VRENGGETLERLIATGKLEDQTRDELSTLCERAVELYIKDHPEAAVGER